MLEQKIAGVVLLYTQIICDRVKAKWGNMQGIEGVEEIHSNLPVIVSNIIEVTIDASGDAAFIKEYGSGHLLDPSSPYFSEYKKSDRWNPERSADGNEFIGRSSGETVYNPDGSTSISTGKAEGMRLEHELSPGYPAYRAFSPTHVIEEEIKGILPDLRASIASAVNEEVQGILTMDVMLNL